MIRDIISGYFLLSGSFFFISTAVAMIRFRDVYSRLHAASKCLTGGSLSLLLALLFQLDDRLLVFKVLLGAFFMLLTSPLASHALARAAYNQDCALESLQRDEYRTDLERERGDRV